MTQDDCNGNEEALSLLSATLFESAVTI